MQSQTPESAVPRSSSLDQPPTRNPIQSDDYAQYTSKSDATAVPGSSALSKSQLQCAPSTSSGHTSKFAKFDVTGPNVTHHENIYLKPVYHTTVRHEEIEEVERVTTIDRHIHHIQYHFQGVIKPGAELRERHSYYELVDPRLNITQAEPIFHPVIEHKLKYQPVSREEFMDQQTAIRPASHDDHFEEHISIGGVGRAIGSTMAGGHSHSGRESSIGQGSQIQQSGARGQGSQYGQGSQTQQTATTGQQRSGTIGTAI